MFTLAFVFLYAFNANETSAATDVQEIEVTFDEYGCGTAPVGMDPELLPSSATFKATVPSKVAKGQEFYLTNVSIT